MKQFYTPAEYAKKTGLSRHTVYRMIKRNDIETLQRTPNCKHLIPAYELPTFIRRGKVKSDFYVKVKEKK